MGEDKPGQRAEAQRLEKEGLTQRSVVLQEGIRISGHLHVI